MAHTVNGQVVIFDSRTDGPHPRLRKWHIPGTKRNLLLRDGAMGFLLIHFALWFDESIERLDRLGEVWDEWGWAVRPVRGQTSGYSQHAGGVAEDLNATKHPRGVSIRHTYTNAQIRKIRLRMKVYNNCLIWGGEFSIPDGMHAEIGQVSLAKCERMAKILMKTPRGQRILQANPGAKAVIMA
jgi:hypothetical protein